MQKNVRCFRSTHWVIIISLLSAFAIIFTLCRIEIPKSNGKTSLVGAYWSHTYSSSGYRLQQRKVLGLNQQSIYYDPVSQKHEGATVGKVTGDLPTFDQRDCLLKVKDTTYKQFQYFMRDISSRLNLTATWDSSVKAHERNTRFKELLFKMTWMTPYSRLNDTGMLNLQFSKLQLTWK